MDFTWHEIQATCQRGKAESLSLNKNPTTNQNLLHQTLRPSPAGLRMWPHKNIFHIQVSYLLCSNPAHKTETGTANRWGTTNSKPHGPFIMMGQSKTLSRTQMMFIILVHTVTEPCTSHRNLYNYSKPKQFFWAKTACFNFSSSNFTVHDHILEHSWRCSKILCAKENTIYNMRPFYMRNLCSHLYDPKVRVTRYGPKVTGLY
jgi:hypothetical protein